MPTRNLDVERRYFDRLIRDQGAFDPFAPSAWETLAEIFARFAGGTHLRILDIGCGSGGSRAVYAAHAEQYVGVDLSLDALRVAKSRLRELDWWQGDASVLPCRDASFDVVAFSSVLHHLGDRRAALREASRVLRPGGSVFAFDPNLLHPPMALFRHPASPCYTSDGVSPLERPLLGRTLRDDFRAAGLTEVVQRAQSGLRYRSVAPRLLNSCLALYHAGDRLLQASGLARWMGAFLITAGRRPSVASRAAADEWSGTS